uniref:Uncharacterized protein n=1 Tax=Bicosoecida sp. CB-2014 TaxID=1486930 RepID=A0A7S1CCG6_9STRA
MADASATGYHPTMKFLSGPLPVLIVVVVAALATCRPLSGGRRRARRHHGAVATGVLVCLSRALAVCTCGLVRCRPRSRGLSQSRRDRSSMSFPSGSAGDVATAAAAAAAFALAQQRADEAEGEAASVRRRERVLRLGSGSGGTGSDDAAPAFAGGYGGGTPSHVETGELSSRLGPPGVVAAVGDSAGAGLAPHSARRDLSASTPTRPVPRRSDATSGGSSRPSLVTVEAQPRASPSPGGRGREAGRR